MRLDFPDGSALELRASGNGNPPDRQGGQATNCSTLWARLAPDGPWRLSWATRSAARAERLVEGCGAATDALERL